MSHRRRRRLTWLAVAGVFGAAVVLTAALFWNTADAVETFSGGKADIYVPPAPHRLTAAERSSLVAVAQQFVRTAVARDHPERAYAIVGPALRGGLTRREWATGDIPVVPYPVESARWKVEYANSEGVGLLVMVYPSAGAKVRPAVFAMNMIPLRLGADSKWLVGGWVPKGGSPQTLGSAARSPGEALGAVAGQGERVASKASPAWLLVPLVLVCLVFVVPVVLLARERRTARRMRRFLDSRSSS